MVTVNVHGKTSVTNTAGVSGGDTTDPVADNYLPPAVSNVCGTVTPICSPPSGSTFPRGHRHQ